MPGDANRQPENQFSRDPWLQCIKPMETGHCHSKTHRGLTCPTGCGYRRIFQISKITMTFSVKCNQSIWTKKWNPYNHGWLARVPDDIYNPYYGAIFAKRVAQWAQLSWGSGSPIRKPNVNCQRKRGETSRLGCGHSTTNSIQSAAWDSRHGGL